MRSEGYIPDHEVAKAFGWDERTVSYRCADGNLKGHSIRGRLYVSAISAQALLRSQGPGTVSHEIERCLKAGEYQRAQDLWNDQNPEYAQLMRTYGGAPAQRQPETAPRGDFGEEFVRKFGG